MIITLKKKNENNKPFTGDSIQVLRPNATSLSEPPVDIPTLDYVKRETKRLDDKDAELQNSIETEVIQRGEDDTALSNRITTNTEDIADNAEAIASHSTRISATEAVNKAQNGRLTLIERVMPGTASFANKLATEAFVNSSINAMAAFYITSDPEGNVFASKAALDAATVFYCDGKVRVPTKNDYCLVEVDETHENTPCRYMYTSTIWSFQYKLNDKPFTEEQLAAINSGVTSNKITGLLHYDRAQELTEEQMAQVRANIGAADTNIPIIPITYEEYKALTPEQKMLDVFYVSTDTALTGDDTYLRSTEQELTNEQKQQVQDNMDLSATLKYEEQTLTEQQRERARRNIGLTVQAIFDIVHPIGDIYVQYPNFDEPATVYNKNGVTSVWTEQNYSGSTGDTGDTETRPENYTIKIWKRTE